MMEGIQKHRVAGVVALLAVLFEVGYRLGLVGTSEAPRMLAVGLAVVALLIFVTGVIGRRAQG